LISSAARSGRRRGLWKKLLLSLAIWHKSPPDEEAQASAQGANPARMPGFCFAEWLSRTIPVHPDFYALLIQINARINSVVEIFMFMVSILYRCPTTGMHTHAWIADEVQERASDNDYLAVECVACRRAHLVHARTGILSSTRKDD
jgi:hypothetical protein